MVTRSIEEAARPVTGTPTSQPVPYSVWILSAVALVYAFFAGMHTLQDFDLWWQLATGRWIIQNHHVFSTDVFSYTASGRPWIYPVLSGIFFYLSFLAGGYALLSWIGALAASGTVALLLTENEAAVPALALIAVPLIANRTQPRAEMFTTVLFAAFLTLLWRYYRGAHSPLWLLPLLMALWVNLHPGFVAGLAMCAGYLLLEVLDLPFRDKQSAAISRLRRAWPWLAAAAAATFVSPFGASMYSALYRQERAQALHNLWVVEWEKVPLSWASVRQGIDWRDPQSSFWWLIIVVVVSACIALWRKQVGALLLLAGSTYLALQHVRLHALFACVVVVVGGSVLGEFWQRPLWLRGDRSFRRGSLPLRTALPSLLAIPLLVLAGARSWDLISDRYYMRSELWSEFGSGVSWWFPERAMDFLQREKLPANVFNGYSLGGYLTWRLFPGYRDYIDGRALPFGPDLFFRAYQLSTEPPESDAWRQEADARGINTIIVPLSRYQGMTLFPQLQAFCRSTSWRAVYLDEVSAVFVRVTPQTSNLASRLAIDCYKTAFVPPLRDEASRSSRAKADLFNFYANAGGVLYSLARYPEALADLDHAQAIAQDNGSVHLLRALVLEQMGRAIEAEAEFRTSLSLEPNDEAWFDLGLFYLTQKRYPDAAQVFRQEAETSRRPHEMWLMLGQANLQMGQPEAALDAFDRAENSSPLHDEGANLGAAFNSLLATGRAKAWYQLGDVEKAVSYQEEAVKLAPNDAKLWLGLADLYEVQGRVTKAAEARLRAKSLGTR